VFDHFVKKGEKKFKSRKCFIQALIFYIKFYVFVWYYEYKI